MKKFSVKGLYIRIPSQAYIAELSIKYFHKFYFYFPANVETPFVLYSPKRTNTVQIKLANKDPPRAGKPAESTAEDEQSLYIAYVHVSRPGFVRLNRIDFDIVAPSGTMEETVGEFRRIMQEQ